MYKRLFCGIKKCVIVFQLGERALVTEDDNDDRHVVSIHDTEDDGDEEDSTIASSDVRPLSKRPKPISMTFSYPSPEEVRFAGTSETKTAANENQSTTTPTSLSLSVIQKNTSVSAAAPSTSTPQNIGSLNHTKKIIKEILKKYPDLTNKKILKLKIQKDSKTGFSTSTSSSDKNGKVEKKVIYIIKKNDIKILKKDAQDFPHKAENTTGPWTCVTCANEDGPIPFETYYMYRRHLQEIHYERFDLRICEHCGWKSGKRITHFYHLYTKHNIVPPNYISFPKCDQCNYIALTESLLVNHRSNHTGMVTKEFICRLCNAVFKSHGALMGHMQTNLCQTDQAEKKYYKCEYCDETFYKSLDLKAHIQTFHQDDSMKKMCDNEDNPDASETQTKISNKEVQTLVSEWEDLEEDDEGESQDGKENDEGESEDGKEDDEGESEDGNSESENIPSRPTMELETMDEIFMW